MLFCTLYKENYVLLIPLIMLLYLYIGMEGKELTWKNLWESILGNLLVQIALALLAAADLLYIVFKVGVDTGGYVGVYRLILVVLY